MNRKRDLALNPPLPAAIITLHKISGITSKDSFLA
jgi:hypothetical protein